MSEYSPVHRLPYIQPSQAQKHVTHNEALRRLDALVQLAVESRTASTPPAAPVAGQRHIVGSGATGDWVGHEGEIALRDETAWEFHAPETGWQAFLQDEGLTVVFDGAAWIPVAAHLHNVAGLGIGASYDASNRLAVAADSASFSHDGTSHFLKVNKASPADTGSLLFQTGWSGRAEMGLVGTDDFQVKVSPDGTTFHDALKVRSATGFAEAKAMMSGHIVIADDNVGYIDTPASGGFVLISIVSATFPQNDHSGIFVYDTGSSLALNDLALGSKMLNLGATALTGTTGTDGQSGIAVKAGQLAVENRFGYPQTFCFTFIGGI